MLIPKPRPSLLRFETIAKKEVADELLLKLVDRVIFDFHLPYLLKAPCPFLEEGRGLDDSYIKYSFSEAERTTVFSDKHEIKSKHSLIRAEIRWQPHRQLRTLISEPLAALTEFPLHVINGLLHSYQFLTGDYTGRHLGPMEFDYLPGEIWFVSEGEPLKIISHFWRRERDLPPPTFSSDTWLYYSARLLSDSPKWLANKLFNSARRASYEHQWKDVFINAVTCIEILANETCRLTASVSDEPRRIMKLRGPRRMLLDGIATHPSIVLNNANFEQLASKWLEDVYVMRNRIVHSGYSEINHDDVLKELTLTGDLARILDSLLADNSPA